MAGAGYKLFATGDVLTAAQVNTYLMQQTVMVFASSAARTSALSGVLAEGMVSYLQDTNTLEVYDGAAWIGATGDITALTAGTGISISSATGPVPTVTNSMATEITAKGDLIVGTGSATFDNLAAGSNGDTLVADSSTSTGLRYTAGTVQANPVLNSAMQIWQRGISVAVAASTNTFTADRWMLSPTTSAYTVARQTTSDTTNLPSIQYCARVQRNSGQTGTVANYFAQSLETVNSIPFVGKTVIMSFYARRGADFSGASNLLGAFLVSGTGTDQNVITAYTGSATVATSNVTLTTTWQRFTVSGTVATSATELAMYFSYTPSGTAGANDYYEITGVQIDIGSVALPFRTYAGTIQGELAACQRYYWRQAAVSSISHYGLGIGTSASAAKINVNNPVTMRVVPTVIDGANLAVNDGTNNTAVSTSTISSSSTQNTTVVDITVASGLTQYRPYFLRENSFSAYLGFGAEL